MKNSCRHINRFSCASAIKVTVFLWYVAWQRQTLLVVVRFACGDVEATEHTVVGQRVVFVFVKRGRNELFVEVVAADSARPE
jgi:hypothetical protein